MGKRRLCYYCWQPMTKAGTKTASSATVEHLTPTSRGGTQAAENKVSCCRRCNNEKGNFTEAEYIAWKIAGRPTRRDFQRSRKITSLALSTEGLAHAQS